MIGGIAKRLANIQQGAGISAQETAQLLGTTAETVSRWRTGKTDPQKTHRDYLLQVEYLVSELAELYPPEEAKLWLFSPHKLLAGQRPADRIRDNHIEDVLTLIAQLKDGAYV
jgi:transcriptional regulator with XRE-family HTH domain